MTLSVDFLYLSSGSHFTGRQLGKLATLWNVLPSEGDGTLPGEHWRYQAGPSTRAYRAPNPLVLLRSTDTSSPENRARCCALKSTTIFPKSPQRRLVFFSFVLFSDSTGYCKNRFRMILKSSFR